MNDASLASFWASTRTTTDADYAITVENSWNVDGTPFWIPLYFLNQYQNGVTTGVNNGRRGN